MADEQTPPTPDAPDGLLSRVRRLPAAVMGKARAALPTIYRYRRAIILTACGLFVLGSALATVRYVQRARERVLAEGLTVEAALARLDAGEYAEARRLARLLPKALDMPRAEEGQAHFVIGASLALETDHAWDEPNRAKLYALAARHLQQAKDLRFPPGREAEGLLLLGRCYVEAGHYAHAVGPLLEIGDDSPALHIPAQRLLALAYLKRVPPDLEKAGKHCEAYMSAPQLSPEKNAQAALLKGEILLAQGKLDACEAILADTPENSDLLQQRRLLQGKLLMARGQAAARGVEDASASDREKRDAYFDEAIEMFRKALSNHATGQGYSSQAAYLIGIALRRQGQLEAAREQFLRTRKRFYDTPEGVMASLEEAEVLQELGDFEAAHAAFERTASHITSPGRFSNPYASEKELRQRIDKGFEVFYAHQRYDLAAALAESLAPLIGKDNATQLYADSLHRWGEHLANQASQRAGPEPAKLAEVSREKYRQAGIAYARLARQRYVTREYPRDLWKSGRNFNLGRDFQSAVVVLEEYLTTEARTERPLVLIALAEAYLSLNEIDKAIASVEECLRDFQTDPAVYRARLLAATIYVEKGDRQRAKKLLRENLYHESLTPESDAWRDSLFALGSVLHDEGRLMMLESAAHTASTDTDEIDLSALQRGHLLLHDAVRQLSEAVARYPQAEQAIEARYKIAESYRAGARLPLEKLKRESIESRRAALNRQIEEELTAGLQHYDKLIARTNDKAHRQNALSVKEKKILRNAYFARGTVLYDLGAYEKAIKAYSSATSRYQHEPAAIEAYMQIAACYRRLEQPLEARGTLEQAKLVLDRIPEDAEFEPTTRFDREEWNTLLNWMSKL